MSQNSYETASKETNLQDFIKPYLNRWWWFILGLLLAGCIWYLYIKKSNDVFLVQSSVLIKDAKNSSGSSEIGGVLSELTSFGGMKSSSVDNELEIFRSKRLMENVVKNLNLQVSVFAEGSLKEIELYKISSPIKVAVVHEKPFAKNPKKPLNLTIKGDKLTLSSEELPQDIVSSFGKTISLPYAQIIITKNDAFNPKSIGGLEDDMDLNQLKLDYATLNGRVNQIQKDLNVDLANKDVTVIRLEMFLAQVHKAEDILNNLVLAYNQDAISDKNTESIKTIEFIDDRIRKISVELGDVERRKEDFKTRNRITDLMTEAKIGLETSAAAREKELELNAQLELTNLLLNHVNKQAAYQLLPINVGLSDSEASSNILNYNQLVLQRNKLLENATPQNPTVVDVTRQIDDLKSSVVQSLVKSKQGLELARAQYTSVQDQISGKIGQIPALESVFRDLERQQNLKEGLYLLLLRKREETAISQSIVVPKARIVDLAYALEKPVSPKKLLTLMLAGLLGLLVPFAIIYIRELFNNKFRTKRELESVAKAPVIAEFPKVFASESIIKKNDLTPLAETFRIMFSNLKFMLTPKDSAQFIFVTSTVKGEGKTFVSMNFALTLATSHHKVLLIGSDIRNPQLQRYDPSKKGVKGLSEYLYDSETSVDEIIYKDQFADHLDIMYSGTIPPNPVELMSNGRYDELLNLLKDRYDYIILDTAPLLLVTDTLLISHLADAFIYVVRSGYTERSLIEFANKNISSGKIKNVAFVLNDVSKNEFGYGNKYGYGYHETQKSFFQRLRERF